MLKELPKIYDPKKVEDKIYAEWENSGYFNPDNLVGEPYSIMMPPPNVTGVLHLGHALENSLMDIMARYQRMQGKKVLLLPGTDHAAVATQAKVEKILIKEGMQNPRAELGREKLLEKIRDYAENSKTTILQQIKKMGTSCDWSRLAYTFDEQRSQAVNEVFVKMYRDGLIYRGYRVINWSVKGQSTCSDDELVYIERPAKLYTFKYSKDFPISIATTRPETKLGDTAVAVNPKDKRYQKYIGKIFTVDVGAEKPLQIKIIADESIDMDFGTGAVGITPAHSMVDFEIYEKQKAQGDPIEIIPIIDERGRVNAGKNYANLSITEAREKFIHWLKENKLLEKEEEITHSVGTSDRFGDVVEILPKIQWFVAVNKEISGQKKTLRDLMREAVTTGHQDNPEQKIKITPARFENSYLSWIENLHDWCISRQVWWGHRIPVWYRGEEIYCDINPPKDAGWTRDPDTLDTWFSSGLWTFSTLGWPQKTAELKTFHPTTWMQMGYEILFFWMARMILMSTYVIGEIPFRNVYIHGMLRDELGKKFSKSAGNNIDPIEVSAEFGTDALRLSLISGITPGEDSKFYEEKIESARNFTNKLWNISRYILMNVDEQHYATETVDIHKLNFEGQAIIKDLHDTINAINKNIENYNFSLAAEILRDFTWNNFADWYLEFSKIEKNEATEKTLIYVLRNILKLWHPFMPFITENIWSSFANTDNKKENLLMIQTWPELKFSQAELNKLESGSFNVERIKQVITVIRNLKAAYKIPTQKVDISVTVECPTEIISYFDRHIKKIAGVKNLNILPSSSKKPESSASTVIGGIGTLYLHLAGVIDIEKEKARYQKEIENLEKFIAGLEGRLKNKAFTEKAPAQVVSQQKESLEKSKSQLAEIKKHLANLK